VRRLLPLTLSVWLFGGLLGGVMQGSPALALGSGLGLLVLVPWLGVRRRATGRPEQQVAVGPDGTEYAWRAAPAPRPSWWASGPWSIWAALTNDESWWLTAWDDQHQGPVLRERFPNRSRAVAGGREFGDSVRRGAFHPPGLPPIRRRRR